jgi:hypothetical protein
MRRSYGRYLKKLAYDTEDETVRAIKKSSKDFNRYYRAFIRSHGGSPELAHKLAHKSQFAFRRRKVELLFDQSIRQDPFSAVTMYADSEATQPTCVFLEGLGYGNGIQLNLASDGFMWDGEFKAWVLPL